MPFQFRKEAIEEDLNSNFPSQGQGNPPLYYSLSEVVVPTYSINSVAEGSGLAENLQTAWDFSTGHNTVTNTATTIINNTGFWLVDLTVSLNFGAPSSNARVSVTDGLTSKVIWRASHASTQGNVSQPLIEDRFVVFLRSGDSLTAGVSANGNPMEIWYRQIATVNGELVNPLGFSFA